MRKTQIEFARKAENELKPKHEKYNFPSTSIILKNLRLSASFLRLLQPYSTDLMWF